MFSQSQFRTCSVSCSFSFSHWSLGKHGQELIKSEKQRGKPGVMLKWSKSVAAQYDAGSHEAGEQNFCYLTFKVDFQFSWQLPISKKFISFQFSSNAQWSYVAETIKYWGIQWNKWGLLHEGGGLNIWFRPDDFQLARWNCCRFKPSIDAFNKKKMTASFQFKKPSISIHLQQYIQQGFQQAALLAEHKLQPVELAPQSDIHTQLNCLM